MPPRLKPFDAVTSESRGGGEKQNTQRSTHDPHRSLVVLPAVRRYALLAAAAAPLDDVRVQVEAGGVVPELDHAAAGHQDCVMGVRNGRAG